MAKLLWDQTGQRFFETGIDQGALYPLTTNGTYPAGYVWNGLTAVTESPSGAEAEPFYADNTKYVNLVSAEEFGGTIEAYTYPDEFGECDGTAEVTPGVIIGQQGRKQFGLVYRTKLGNDVSGQDLGYKLHLVYGALAAPSEKAYTTVNDTPEAVTFSWEFTTTPVAVTGHKPTSTFTINSTTVNAAKLLALETILFGDATNPARLPLPDEVITLLSV